MKDSERKKENRENEKKGRREEDKLPDKFDHIYSNIRLDYDL